MASASAGALCAGARGGLGEGAEEHLVAQPEDRVRQRGGDVGVVTLRGHVGAGSGFFLSLWGSRTTRQPPPPTKTTPHPGGGGSGDGNAAKAGKGGDQCFPPRKDPGTL